MAAEVDEGQKPGARFLVLLLNFCHQIRNLRKLLNLEPGGSR